MKTTAPAATKVDKFSHKHSALGSSLCAKCVALRPAAWYYSDAYRQCVNGCEIKRGARYYRDAYTLYCLDHAPRP